MVDAAAPRKSSRRAKKLSDAEKLEEILEAMYARIKEGDEKPKVADFLKALEMKHKLKLTDEGRKRLLDMIEKVRREELEKLEETNAANEDT
jgi:hypothetical protein